jgi:hypothetical protein
MSITWDVRMPYGCKLMGFRSKVTPSLEVLRTDGRHCGGFVAKPAPQKSTLAKTTSRSQQVETPTDPRKLSQTGIKILV